LGRTTRGRGGTLKLKTLTYTSRARLDLSQDDLADIHHSARHLNALDGITGLLVFDGTRFLQIVEGAEEAVDTLVERLRADTRHSAFEIRDERVVAERSFPGWSMELVRVNAGYVEAEPQIEARLPAQVALPVRRLILKMAAAMAGTSAAE
jgi:Sensors of blue-light using FAD